MNEDYVHKKRAVKKITRGARGAQKRPKKNKII